jgi:hypothetical protein
MLVFCSLEFKRARRIQFCQANIYEGGCSEDRDRGEKMIILSWVLLIAKSLIFCKKASSDLF